MALERNSRLHKQKDNKMKTRLITLLACAVMAQEVVGQRYGDLVSAEFYDGGSISVSTRYLWPRRSYGSSVSEHTIYDVSCADVSSIKVGRFGTNDVVVIDTGRGLFDDGVVFDDNHRTNRTRIQLDNDFEAFLIIDGGDSRHLDSLGVIHPNHGQITRDAWITGIHRKRAFHHYKGLHWYLWRRGADLEVVYDDYKIYTRRRTSRLESIIEITTTNRFVDFHKETPIDRGNSSSDTKIAAPIEMFPLIIRNGKKSYIALGGEGLELEVSGSIVNGRWHKIRWGVDMHNGLALASIVFDPSGRYPSMAFYRINKPTTHIDIPVRFIDNE